MRCQETNSWAYKKAACISDGTKLTPKFIHLQHIFLNFVMENMAPIGPIVVQNFNLENRFELC